MNYYDSNDNRSKTRGAIALVLYVATFILVMAFASFTIDMPNVDQGILVNFGNTDDGSGATDLAVSEPAPKAAAPKPQAVTAPEKILTTNDPDAPETVEKTEVKPKPKVEKTVEPQPAPREVNKKALFPGRTEGSVAKSEGEKTGTGNQGTINGSPEGVHATGAGSGTSGVSFDLTGRSPIGHLGQPLYSGSEQGRVVIQIVVNARGEVTSATFRPKGSTSDRSELVEAARKVALKSRFTPAEEGTVQTGTITYIFRLN